MTYFVYFLFAITSIALFFIILQFLNKVEDRQMTSKVIRQYHPVALASKSKRLLDDSKLTHEAEIIIRRTNALNVDKKRSDTFLSKLNYKLRYAYGDNPLKNFIILLMKSAIFFTVIVYFIKLGLIPSIIIIVSLGFFGACIMVNRAYDKKISRFLDNFVYAMDIIARGVRAGLPTNTCFKQIVQDVDITVGEQFLAILDDYKLGMTTEQAMQRLMSRIPLKEVNFFCLSIMIQGKTGGNLAQIISNLATILRKRKSLLIKIQTLSSEAKSGAIVLGSMPIAVLGMLSMIAPDYVSVLFHTSQGNYVLIGCAVWMSMGGLIMRQMINFYK